MGIGVGVRIAATDPIASIEAQCRSSVPRWPQRQSPMLIGSGDAVVTVTAEVTVDASARAWPGASRQHPAASGVPTGGGAAPTISLALQQLQMPGASSAEDLTVSADNADELEHSILNLVLGLVRAQAAALPPGPLTALAGLIGLRDGIGVPALPFTNFATQGVHALSVWLEGVLQTPGSRLPGSVNSQTCSVARFRAARWRSISVRPHS